MKFMVGWALGMIKRPALVALMVRRCGSHLKVTMAPMPG